jgi:hypothetical protein
MQSNRDFELIASEISATKTIICLLLVTTAGEQTKMKLKFGLKKDNFKRKS